MSAIISKGGSYRYRLDRFVQKRGRIFAFLGVNPSTADADLDDATVRKWIGFTKAYGGSRFIVGNVFAFRSTDVTQLIHAKNPVGPENEYYLEQIVAEADIIVPCWGNRTKIPKLGGKSLDGEFDKVLDLLRIAGKPVMTFGLTKRGDPKHPLMLPYSTPLIDFPLPKKRRA